MVLATLVRNLLQVLICLLTSHSCRRHLGGLIPRTIEVHNPRLNTKVTIDIPDGDGSNNGALYCTLRRDNIIELCVESLQKVPDYKFLWERALDNGKSLQLAWRYQANLDWVWLDEDVFGKVREWSVLCGLALKHVKLFQRSISARTLTMSSSRQGHPY